MIDYVRQSLVIYSIITLALTGGVAEVLNNVRKVQVISTSDGDFAQPNLQVGTYPWSIRSIDTQVVSKHWPDVPQAAIDEQVDMLAALGVNYIAIATPYDRADELKMWADTIHDRGLHVWFRSHWAEWEGDDGRPATLSPDEYLQKTRAFIINNPDLFKPGDAFTVAVEAENVGIGLGKRFLTWDQYRDFLLSQITVANEAFSQIGLEQKVYTNWLSMNGWVVENQLTQEVVDKIGLIVVDHYVEQTKTIGDVDNTNTLVTATIDDLRRFHRQWDVPILLGEWGYQIFQDVPEEKQAEVIGEMYRALTELDFLVGVNYWTHMGNTASLISDFQGSQLEYRQGALVVKDYYDPLGQIELNLDKLEESSQSGEIASQ